MLIFDFDGVLMNSMDEIVVTAYNAATGKLATSLEELPDKLPRMFRRNRFHVQPIGDAPPLMRWCLETVSREPDRILSAREYASVIEHADRPVVDRTNRFFAVRERFVRKDRESWLSLHSPSQPIWDELIRRGPESVIILTNKNRTAVLELCRHFGLMVESFNIYSGDEGAAKTDNLKRIFNRLGEGPHTFIDDSVKNLAELDEAFNRETPRLKLILAAWGYLGPTDESTAESLGFPVFSQIDLIGEMNDIEWSSFRNDSAAQLLET